MIIEKRVYKVEKGDLKLIFKNEKKLNKEGILKEFTKWYERNPYAKKITDEWICGDYRIDQQRPQRNVYSNLYIKIVNITEIEEIFLNNLIQQLESKIDYPTVWDDGENRYYEETIYCPKCGHRRKVLTSETHCEECGFEFAKSKKCSKCGNLVLENDNFCHHCGWDLNEEYVHKNNQTKQCSECFEMNNSNNLYCEYCGHKLKPISDKSKDKNYCQLCGEEIDIKDNFCGTYGHKIERDVKKNRCPICGEWVSDKYCWNCGHDRHLRSNTLIDRYTKKVKRTKKCPNCNGVQGMLGYPQYFQYCEDCGAKLVKK